MRDPSAPQHVYRRVLVALPINDLSERRLVEDRFSAERDGVFVPSYTVLFPGRVYSSDELAQAVIGSGSDAVLVITLNAAGAKHSVESSTFGTATAGCYVGGCSATSATTTNVYDISKPWATFTAQLVDVQTGRAVWVATSQSKGNAYARASTLLTSMAETTIGQLRRDGLISPPLRPGSH